MSLPALRRLLATRRCAWLLALALCLPVAQWATATHALLHLHAAAAADGEKQAPLPAFCDTCVLAAAIGGAAPLPQLPTLPSVMLSHTQPADVAPAEHFPIFLRAYRSRAPPLSHA